MSDDAMKIEPIPCPFCGGEIRTLQARVLENREGMISTFCDDCGYAGAAKYSRQEAIAEHNRVARLAAAVEEVAGALDRLSAGHEDDQSIATYAKSFRRWRDTLRSAGRKT